MIDVNSLLKLIKDLVRGGSTPQEAYKNLTSIVGDSQDLLKEALRQFEQETKRIRTLREPVGLYGDRIPGWYTGPSAEDRFWPALRKYLLENKGWDEVAIDSVDQASTKIVSNLEPPGRAKIDTRGLVVGYVQSGKTANYTAVIAKTADVRYKFFVVLAGMTNSLRSQTQARLNQDLVDLTSSEWIVLTDVENDFYPGPHRNVNAFLADHSHQRVLCVVKKNSNVLKRLLMWLKAASKQSLSNCPVLIIDDEADQASVNASRYAEERTRINSLLLEILTTLPKAAYIGYTATPFANVFIDPSVPEDLYPRDFIIDLPKPDNYFGPERIYGRDLLDYDEDGAEYEGLDVIRLVDSSEVPLLKPHRSSDRYGFEPEITQSLENALRYFWMAASARIARGQVDQHSTMLIHTSMYIDIQERFSPLIEQYKRAVVNKLRRRDDQFEQELRTQWQEEQGCLPAVSMGETSISFDQLRSYLTNVVEKADIVVENSRSDRRLSYEEGGQIQIVIGGNTLSRGLTLEGLIVSFFIRTSNAYDTLLQMGRWFGYRKGYSDLPRIWMTPELMEYFYDLATVEQEIRNDIARYEEDMTPLQFGIRIKQHPALNITSQLKMQAAVPAEISFDNGYHQTVIFDHKDNNWLLNNQKAVRNLIENIAARNIDPDVNNGRIVFHNVPVVDILMFFNEYQVHPETRTLQPRLIKGYIRNQNDYGELEQWNVVIKRRKILEGDELINLGAGIETPLLTRSKRRSSLTSAHLGVIMSHGDVIIDLDLEPAHKRGQKDSDLQKHRPTGIGLLVIYPISKDSQSKSKDRVPLEASEHIIGFGIVFPKATQSTPQTYMTVDLSGVEMDELEWDPLAEDEAV